MKKRVLSLLIALFYVTSGLLIAKAFDSGNSVQMIPCPTEDSINCYWDAKEHGNGQGTSFVNINGKIHYFH